MSDGTAESISGLREENARLRRENEYLHIKAARARRTRDLFEGILLRVLRFSRLSSTIRALLKRIGQGDGFPADELGDVAAALLRRMLFIGIVGTVLATAPVWLLWRQNTLIAQQTIRLEEQNRLFETQNSELKKQSLDEFEPRLIVSRLVPKRFVETDGASHLKLGTLSIKNVGKGEALQVRCYVLNPHSGNHKYVPFGASSSAFNLCDGERFDDRLSNERSPRYTVALLPTEEREICIGEDLNVDFSVFEMFLAVSCDYFDKDLNPKGGEIQTISVGGTMTPSSESDAPALRMLEYLEKADERVKRWRQLSSSKTRPKSSGGSIMLPATAAVLPQSRSPMTTEPPLENSNSPRE